MEGDAKAIVQSVVDQAKAGDLQACKIIIDRIALPAKSRRVNFSMPAIESMADIVAAHQGLWAAVSSGKLSIDEALALGGLLEKTAETFRSHDLERRIERLESDRERRI